MYTYICIICNIYIHINIEAYIIHLFLYIHLFTTMSCWFDRVAGGQVAPRGRWAGLWINGDLMVI